MADRPKLSIIKGEKTMLIDLTKTIVALDADGTEILNKEQKHPTLKEVCQFALRAAHQADQNQGWKEKMDRYNLLKKIDGSEKLEISEGESKLVKERIGKCFMQVTLIGRASELLDGAE